MQYSIVAIVFSAYFYSCSGYHPLPQLNHHSYRHSTSFQSKRVNHIYATSGNNEIPKYSFSRFSTAASSISLPSLLSNLPNNIMSQIPNVLTVLRVLAIPPFMLTFVQQKKSAASAIYLIACLSDLLDGWLARKLNIVSSFGIFLDPVADKLMVATALVFLVTKIPIWWFALAVALIIGREIFISALREWMAQKGEEVVIKVGQLGKIKTALQMISTWMLLETCPGSNLSSFDLLSFLHVPKPPVFLFALLLFFISTALTVISGSQYFMAAWPFLIQPHTVSSTVSSPTIIPSPSSTI